MIKVIVFDFDGTIADTHDALVEITNRLAGEFGYKPVDEEKLQHFKNLSSRDIVKQSEISLFKIPFLLKRIKSELGKEIIHLKPVSGLGETLLDLKNQGYQLGIITSNEKNNVLAFLKENNLELVFDFIYSGIAIFGKDRIMAKFIKNNGLTKNEAIYVGDETRDIEAAKKSGMPVIAVSWGFNSAEILAKHKPDFLIDHPRQLLEVVKCCPEHCVVKPVFYTQNANFPRLPRHEN